MGELFNNLYNIIMDVINSSVVFGPIFACILIFFESLIPVLPLFIFITIIFIAYGYVFGFLISYILTCLGCMFSFFLFRKFFKNLVDRKVRSKVKIDKLMKKLDKMSLSSLVLLIAIPFTPAFLINIAAGLSKMPFKRFLISILIGKLSLVIFWGFIGTSLVESLQNPKILIIIGIMLLLAYGASKIVSKKLKLE